MKLKRSRGEILGLLFDEKKFEEYERYGVLFITEAKKAGKLEGDFPYLSAGVVLMNIMDKLKKEFTES